MITADAQAERPETLRGAFTCDVRLPGWKLHLAHLQEREERDLGNVMDVAAEGALAEVKRAHPAGRLETSATTLALREELLSLGVNHDATPPHTERVIQDVLRAGRLPRGPLTWDLLVVLMLKSEAPWFVVDRDLIEPPVEWRLGEPGEALPHDEAVLDCEGLPVLGDRQGVKASPWNRVLPEDLAGCREPVFVCALPAGLYRRFEPKGHVGRAVWLTWAYRFVFERTCSFRAGPA